MKRTIALVVMILSISFIHGQNKMLSMEDAMLKARTTLAPENLQQLQFYGTTNDYVYLKKINGNDAWIRGNNKMRSDTLFMSLIGLNTRLKTAGLDTVMAMPSIKFAADGWIMTISGDKILLDPSAPQYRVLMPREYASKDNAEESKAGFVAYLDNHNLFVAHFANIKAGSTNETPVQVTTDGSKDIVYASSVHREEFGISKGTFWSNDGTKLAFYRMDQSMVTDYPIIDWSVRPARVELIKYPMAGDKSHQVTVGVYNTVNHSTVWLKTGEPVEQYLTNIAWSPDDKYIYIAVLNRGQNHMWLNQYDAGTGNFVKTLFEETDDKYVEPLVPMLFMKNDPAQFIWQSNRDGWNHLYLYDTSGKLIRQMTRGSWEVLELKGFDAKGENLFYVSTMQSPANRSLCELNIKSGLNFLNTKEPAVHSTLISMDGNSFLDNFSTISKPRTIQLIGSGKPKILLQASNPLNDYQQGSLSEFTIRNHGGDSLFCRMFKPVGFTANKKYPVIVYWYGGPHAQLVLNSWNGGAGDYWFQFMAERGYIVFTVDTRGSDNRGRAFEQTIFREQGKVQMEDLMDAVNYLGATSFADTSRMGLFGWSYGGFMTTDFMLNHPGVFKAAVAGGPVMNWHFYEIMYGERYMDTPQENPQGYEKTNLIKQAAKLKGKLLLIHGLQDPVVVQENSVAFVKACVDAGVQIDYMIYPGHEHNVLGKDRAHLYQKVTDYLTAYVK
jgi:dipeptidyl-peptidase 4